MTESSLDFMKTQPALTLIASAIALSLPVALAPQAQAAGIVRGSTATSSLATNLGSIANVTNQSGLSATYVSGTTDFDSYVATTTHNSSSAGTIWRVTPKTGFIAFDLGASYTLDAFALWPLNPGAVPGQIRGFTLYADTDADPTNPGTSLGNFTAVAAPSTPVAAQVFNFTAITTRFIQLQIISSTGTSAPVSGFGEVAFRSITPAATTPEPSALVGLGAVVALGLGLKRRHA